LIFWTLLSRTQNFRVRILFASVLSERPCATTQSARSFPSPPRMAADARAVLPVSVP